jgi:hypothetical protein
MPIASADASTMQSTDWDWVGRSIPENLPSRICRARQETRYFVLDWMVLKACGKPVAIDMRFCHFAGQLRDPEVKPQQLFMGFHRNSSPSGLNASCDTVRVKCLSVSHKETRLTD